MWTIQIPRRVQKIILALPVDIKSRVQKTIDDLVIEPAPFGSIILKNRDGNRRVRVGDYRIIYHIWKMVVTIEVVDVAHRRDVYRD